MCEAAYFFTSDSRRKNLKGDDNIGKLIIITLSESEEHIIDKVLSVLSDKQDLEQVSVPDSPILTFGDLKILPRRRQVYMSSQEVSLTTREFDVLYYLAQHAGQVLTARQIYEAASGESAVVCDYHSIESSVYSIRKKLGRDVILTVRGYGYKFNWK